MPARDAGGRMFFTVTSPDAHQVRDQRIDRIVPLMSPALLHHELPLTPDLSATVLAGRRAVAAVLDGTDERLLVVVGPCSVHDPVAAAEYADLLTGEAARLGGGPLGGLRGVFA